MIREIRKFLSHFIEDRSSHSKLKSIFNPSLYLFSKLYHLGFIIDRWRKLKKIKKINGADAIISVGNITWGGTGKTPMVQFLCQFCLKRNLLPIIISRGYGNDESLMLENFSKKHGIFCGFGKDRFSIIENVLMKISTDPILAKKKKVILLDDGMQTHQLYRDLNIIMIHAQNPFGNGNLIPRGILRETMQSCFQRTQIVTINHSNLVSQSQKISIKEQIVKINPSICFIESNYIASKLISILDEREVNIAYLKNKRIIQFSGISSNSSFSSLLKDLDLDLIQIVEFTDHHPFTLQELLKIKELAIKNNAILITTEKDMFRSSLLMKEVFTSIEAFVLLIDIHLQSEQVIENYIKKLL